MADVYAVNFNTGDNSELTATSGSVTFVSDVYHSGGYSMRSAGTADYAYRTLASTYTELYARGYFRLASTPTTSGEDVRVLDFRDSSGVSMVWLSFQYCCGQRRLRIYCARNGNTYAYNYDYQAEVWYPLELYWNEGTGSDGEIRVWVDNNEVITQTGLSITGNNVARVYFGHINSEYNTAVWTDCIAVSTTGPIYNHDTSFEEDWEDATFDAWDGQTGSPTITGLVRHNGVYSVQNSVVSLNYEGSYINVGHMKSSYWMFEVRFNERPASGDYIEFARFSRGGTDLLKLRVKNDAGTYKWGY
ncbi:MAG: hypothetical protein GWN76_02630, partial [candidate division Zixibacteria bacterium]|nr:hypothetical protein [candidate division Zixibacteria bacterium]NIR62769.1 hypothetical protein [candidate division Zixibacteria bacterium]NIS44839.1 hypothetical protein [candidate division Zixibacteria bacterium]NIU12932.1 hypothetical protein [candidate division Zixibacteria bacterium]